MSLDGAASKSDSGTRPFSTSHLLRKVFRGSSPLYILAENGRFQQFNRMSNLSLDITFESLHSPRRKSSGLLLSNIIKDSPEG